MKTKTYQRFVPLVFGSIMKEKRIALKLEQEQLAKKLGVSRASLCYWENGRQSMNLETYFKLCKELKISGDELFKRAVKYETLKELIK